MGDTMPPLLPSRPITSIPPSPRTRSHRTEAPVKTLTTPHHPPPPPFRVLPHPGSFGQEADGSDKGGKAGNDEAAVATGKDEGTEGARLLPEGGSAAVAAPPPVPFAVGVVSAMVAGVFGGSFLVPNMSCCADDGTMFVPSMGIGCLLTAPFFSAAMYALDPPTPLRPLVPPVSVLIETLPGGCLGGTVSALAIILIIEVSCRAYMCFRFWSTRALQSQHPVNGYSIDGWCHGAMVPRRCGADPFISSLTHRAIRHA